MLGSLGSPGSQALLLSVRSLDVQVSALLPHAPMPSLCCNT